MKYLIPCMILLSISYSSIFGVTDFEIKGKVIDAKTGNPVAYATIQVKNYNISTQTLIDGSFSLTVPDKAKTLICTAIGYGSEEIRIGKKGESITIKLQVPKDEEKLSDAVVVSGLKAEQQSASTAVEGRLYGVTNQKKQINPPVFNTEDYDAITENRFLETSSNPLSTFSIDVDGASYSNARRFLNMGQLPPAGSVRVEEFINYFHYNYPQPNGSDPFSINTEASECPWNPQHKLVMIGLQGKKIPTEKLPAANLVFLIDVSGSMMDENKLPLVQSAMKLLTEQLREQDKVSIVVYAGSAGLVLPSVNGDHKQTIKDAIDALQAGGSTAGGEGIQLAYKVARENFMKNGNNRIILCTDGDFNVGLSSDAELERMIEQERKSGIYLTVLGFGMGNYKDNKMQKLADKGNGNHGYIDGISEAKKVLVNEFGGTLFTIAKDVKLQVEFNPAKVQAYRLIGYENRMLKKEDFNNDLKDAGEIGSGHTVTALYELIPTGIASKWIEKTDPLKYQKNEKDLSRAHGDELMTIKFRYKAPDGEKSKLIEHTVKENFVPSENISKNFRMVAAVAQFGMILSNSEFRQGSSFKSANQLAAEALSEDTEGYRKEFIELIDKAVKLSREETIGRK